MLPDLDLLVDVVVDLREGAPLDDGDHHPGPVVDESRDLLALPLVREHGADVACTEGQVPTFNLIFW